MTTNDGKTYPAQLVGSDAQTDLALLKIDATGLTPAQFGKTEELQVGEEALAVGDPLGATFHGTLTNGILSGINRDVTLNGYSMTLLQTTAALNSGNSGGPLVNMYGQVIGITNLKMQSYYDTVEGLGFAIPTATVKAVVDTLIETGVVTGRPTIGITAYTLTQAMAEAEGLPQGVCIKSVQAGSDAWRQGLRAGDVIVEANGVSIRTMDELQALKNGMQVGEVLSLRYCRENGWHTADVTLVDQYTLED